MEKKRPVKGRDEIMRAIAAAIVKGRYVIFLFFAVAALYCVLSLGKVKVNSDITAFLPENTETKQSLAIMEEEFVTYASADVMVSNITYETAEKLSEDIAGFDKVFSVSFDDTASHYKNSAARFTVSFDGTESDESVIAAMDSIKEYLADYDTYISSTIGVDYTASLANEMLGVIAIAAVVIVAVLLFTSRSYFEVVIFGIVFVFAGLLNMGTNFWFGEISSITNSIAVILQLALAIDYAIIFSHRYQDEAEKTPDEREALIEALSKAIIEISASSLTTISGLVALTLMQFGLGYDLGIVLSKGILCSLITVFLLMPGLISLFPKVLKKTAHRTMIPNIRPWGRFLTKSKFCFVIIFAVLLPFAIYFSNHTEYAFSDSGIDELVYSESRSSMHKIADTFDNSTSVAVLLPAGDYEKEKAVLDKVSALDGVESSLGLAGIEIDDGVFLTDSCNPRTVSEILNIDIEEATLLFQAYGAEHNEYQAIFGNSESYEVVLLDLFEYLFEKIDLGIVTLDSAQTERLDYLRTTLKFGTDQLRGENWDRLILTASVPVEGEESIALVDKVREIAEQEYGEGNILTAGYVTSARDLAESYNSDLVKINFLTIGFVFIVLLCTFKTVVGSAVLVFVIQGSIWINFSFPYLQDFHTSFVTNMIVSAIQMGATIDYAIVIMNRYLVLKRDKKPKEAMTEAVNESLATVLTSGLIMTIAGFLIAYRVSDVYVGHIGLAVGRGALISIVLVMTVLPQLILLCDKLIEKTTFTLCRRTGGEER